MDKIHNVKLINIPYLLTSDTYANYKTKLHFEQCGYCKINSQTQNTTPPPSHTPLPYRFLSKIYILFFYVFIFADFIKIVVCYEQIIYLNWNQSKNQLASSEWSMVRLVRF